MRSPSSGAGEVERDKIERAALERLRVVDLTDLRGALAGRMLADLGADVIKVEPPGGDPDRLRGPFAGDRPEPDGSLSFLYRNAGKRGAVIDLDLEAGRTRFEELCAHADVLIENLGPAGQARQCLTPHEVRARHPHLVHLTISDFGLSGPRSGWRLEPLTAFAASGALHASGLSDRPPCWLPGYLAHDCASILGVVGALAALLARDHHGHGQTVEVSVQEAALCGLDPWSIPLADYARLYPFLPTAVPRDGDGAYFVLPTSDGYVRVAAATPRQVAAFTRLLWGPAVDSVPAEARRDAQTPRASRARSADPGQGSAARGAEWLESEWLEGLRSRALAVVNSLVLGTSRIVSFPDVTLSMGRTLLDTARALAGRALRSRPRDEVLRTALRLGLPMAAVNTPEEFVDAEQTRQRAFFCRTGFPKFGEAPVASPPWRLSATPARLRRPPPAPGEDAAGGFAEADGRGEASRGQAACASQGSDRRHAEAPLVGVRVIDLGVAAVGPELCWILGELGAEVIKIESATHLDVLRRVTPDLGNPNASFPFNDACRGQKSVCLDLRAARARELALALCAQADIVVENHRGGVVRSWGLDHPAVRRVRPDVIYFASQGYGRGGPLGEAPAYGPVNSAFAGATWLWNHPDAPYPAGSSLNHPDHIASKLGAVAVLAALEHRRRTGEGQFIEMAQTEAAAYLMGELYLEQPLTGRPTRQRGNAVDYACPHGVYPCAGDDRWCAIAVVGDGTWERFCRALGWESVPRLAELAGRLAERDALDRRVAAWTRSRAPAEAAAILQAADVSAMPVDGSLELRADPHLAARAALVRVVHPDVGASRHIANPIRMSYVPRATPTAAPRLGEHTVEVLTGVLGLEENAVKTLIANGICG